MTGKAGGESGPGPARVPPDSATTILERVTDGFFAVDREWRITALNPVARRSFEAAGGPGGEPLGQSLWEALPRLQGTRTEEAYREAMASREPVHLETFAYSSGAWFDVDAYPSPEGLSVYFRDVSSRKRTEEALRESESLFRQLAETIREVLWVVSPDLSRVEYLNPAYEEIFGRSRAETYARPETLLEAVLTEDRERVRGAFERAAEGDFQIEYRLLRPDGELRWIWARGVPVRDETGSLLRIVGISEDITGRKEGEEQRAFLAEAGRVLASSLDYEETLRTVARLAVPRIADWTAIYVYEDGQLRTIEVAHVDPEKVALVRAMAERYPEDPDAETGIRHVLRTGEPEFYGEIPQQLLDSAARDEEHRRMIHALGLRSGMTVPMIARGRTVGAITFIAAESGRRYTIHDLRFAEQLASRAALAVDNARLFAEAHRRMVEERALRVAAEAVSASFTVDEVIDQIARSALEATSADGALVEQVDPEHGLVRVVASYQSGGFLRGATVPLHGSTAEYVIETRAPLFIARLDEAEHPLPVDLVRSRGDSSALVLPLANGGEAVGALFLLRAAGHGAFREDEAERATIFAKLATLAFRKVHLLHESEQRRGELEAVMESRARLVRGFTHDLRNPLGAADGFLDLVASGVYGNLGEQQQAALARARGLLRSALGLIGDVLELARVETGQLEIEPGPVDVNGVAREIVEEFRPQAEAKGLLVQAELPTELPLVQSDASRIRQILGNLMSNAVKFTSTGRITISASLREDCPDVVGSSCIALAVSDTGPGVPADKQALLFREFSRVGIGGQAGAGLGLAISRNLAEALGGSLTLHSEEGRGATFTLWIPAAPEALATADTD